MNRPDLDHHPAVLSWNSGGNVVRLFGTVSRSLPQCTLVVSPGRRRASGPSVLIGTYTGLADDDVTTTRQSSASI